ncbi:MAG: hypothetical protein K6F93_02145 [Lachnospiraceae bacterium]|nr:hypothetical protein [Lachnospiraceae bacterium]
MTKKAKSSIFIVIISAVLLAIIGCSSASSQVEDKKKDTTVTVVKKDPDPTPSPTPTPLVDMEEGTYDINEMPLFAIEGTDYTPFSLELEKISAVTEDGTPVEINEDDPEETEDVDTEASDADTEGEESKEDDTDEEDEESEESDEEKQKIYNTYKVVLKSGLKFPDGSTVTADDVMFNIKAHAARDYKGDFELGELDIPGMREYHTQIPEETRELVETIINAGGFDIEEGKYPEIEGVDPKLQDEIWACYDEAGLIFARNIIDHVNSNYALNAYVNAFMSGYLTYAKVEASDSLKTAFAYIVWGYGRKKNPYNYRKNTLTTISDKVYELNEVELTEMDFWEEIKEYYKGDLSDEGIDNDVAPGTPTIEELIAQVYFEKQDYSVENIKGILKGTTFDEKIGTDRECIFITISDDEDINDFNFFLTNPKEYEKTSTLNDPEVIIEIDDEEEGEEGEEGEESDEDSEGENTEGEGES